MGGTEEKGKKEKEQRGVRGREGRQGGRLDTTLLNHPVPNHHPVTGEGQVVLDMVLSVLD